MKYFRISIDPGTPSGYAVWDEATWKELIPPAEWGVTPAGSKDLFWHQRATITADSVHTLLEKYGSKAVRVVYCEQPILMTNSVAGQAASRKGDLVKLSMMVGRIMEICSGRNIPFRLVEVNRWKGQLSKTMVENRIRQKLPSLAAKSHAWDAVGIGLFVKGFF